MPVYKYIYWRPGNESDNGKMSAYLHLLTNENEGTVSLIQEMTENLKKTFPEATNDKIFVAKIVKSSRFKGYLILIWNAQIKVQNYPNWVERDFNKIEYMW